MAPSHPESEPLLPAPVTHSAQGANSGNTGHGQTGHSTYVPTSPTISRSKLGARRTTPAVGSSTTTAINNNNNAGLSEKSRGKQRAMESDLDLDLESQTYGRSNGFDGDVYRYDLDDDKNGERPPKPKRRGRCITIIFSGEGETRQNLELWVEDGESVGKVKEQIRHLRPALDGLSLRLIHSGRLLTDGILLLSWLRSLEERVKRQTGGMGRDVEKVLKDVGLTEAEEDDDDSSGQTLGLSGSGANKDDGGDEKVWLHCVVGSKVDEKPSGEDEDEPVAPRRRGFDTLLDAGLSPADVAAMRRQFYESRGEEVPEGLEGEQNDEHSRALEEQWIEGDMTAETATTSTEGMYTSILHGLLTGFLYPIIPWFFFRETPLPNFFDADAEAMGSGEGSRVSERVAENGMIGGEVLPSVVFGKRMQMGILIGTILNVAFGALRFLN